MLQRARSLEHEKSAETVKSFPTREGTSLPAESISAVTSPAYVRNQCVRIVPIVDTGVTAFRVDAPIRGVGLRRTVVKSNAAPKTFEILRGLADEPEHNFSAELLEFNAIKRLGLLVPVEQAPERVAFACTLPNDSGERVRSTAIRPEAADGWSVNPETRIQSKSDAFAAASELWRRVAMLGKHEIVWVQDPCRRVKLPYWLNDLEATYARQLISGALLPKDLRVGIRSKFADIGLIYPTRWVTHSRRTWSAKFNNARRNISHRGYAVLRDLIPPVFAQGLRRYYRNLVTEGFLVLGDHQAMRYNLHNEPFSFWLHRYTERFIGRAIPEPIKSSYSYVAAYLPGAILGRHTDRVQCEYTVSLSIDAISDVPAPKPWPLYLELPSGKVVRVILEPGDALVFKGRELPHFRPQLRESCSSTSLLFHYVQSDYEGPLLAAL